MTVHNGIGDYLNDHAAAGHCAYMWYHSTHDVTQCPAPAGTCAVIGYLAGKLLAAETLSNAATPLVTNANTTFDALRDPLRDTPSGGWQAAPETR